MKTKIRENKSSIITVSKKLMMAMTIAAAAIATTVNAQQPPAPGNATMQPPPPARERGLQPPTPNQPLQRVVTYLGKVVKMKTNDDYVYDCFYMLNNGDSLLVKFPPHWVRRLQTRLKPVQRFQLTVF